MRSLPSIQAAFQDYVLGRDEGGTPIAALVVDQFGLGADARLAIYYNAYRSRLGEALGEAYPKLWTYVGDDMFDELAAGYLDAHPSSNPNLRWFGDRFADYLGQALPDYPYLAELARFEWTLGLAFDARDCTPLDAAALAALAGDDWDGLALALHPSASRLTMHWNTVALWQALHTDAEPPAMLAQASQVWLIWRRLEQPHFRSLDEVEAAALAALDQGLAFGPMCAAAAALKGSDVTLDLAGHLQNWMAHGLLTARP